MKRNAINLFYRKIYKSKIEVLEQNEIKFRIYTETNGGKSHEDYIKNIFIVINSEATYSTTNLLWSIKRYWNLKMIEESCRMQALCNLYEQELDKIEERIRTMPITELKNFFKDYYKIVKKGIKSEGNQFVTNTRTAYSKYLNSNNILKGTGKNLLSYVFIVLSMNAIDEMHGQIDHL